LVSAPSTPHSAPSRFTDITRDSATREEVLAGSYRNKGPKKRGVTYEFF